MTGKKPEDYYGEIIELFRKGFCKEIYKKEYVKASNKSKQLNSKRFICGKRSENCKVNLKKEAVWSPALGSSKSKVMIVAEAPSTTEGTGLHIGGMFKKWETKGKKSDPCCLRNFARDTYDGTPYFTDLVKCGAEKQSNKSVLKNRKRECIQKFLVEEIKIVKPYVILCCGAEPYKELKKLQKSEKYGGILRESVLIQLLHYSSEGKLPLNKDDKKLVWKHQIGMRLPGNYKLSRLSFFNKKPRD